ncbi:MAG: molecular chaperone HtpG [Eubacteriales bacterium]|nr:molecular chaperone HtpG [Eubacteriales bacterium]
MNTEHGTVSVNTENIFPIIRKWLYSDQDIFLRELVSNATDAIAKLKRLSQLGEADGLDNENYRIDVIYDNIAQTLTIQDNGIGMTAEEIRTYINQIAFSGAMDFVEKYKEKGAETTGIIGHFGLGFYSAFMVADLVRIDTLSYKSGSEAASWTSEDGMAYDMGPSDRTDRGTSITLTLSEEGQKFLSTAKIKEILNKYCNFMPFPIYLTDVAEAAQKANELKPTKDHVDAADIDAADEATGEAIHEDHTPQPINDTTPLWQKDPKDCTDEEYKAFFRKTFNDYRDPLFWIHLNIDYPFNLKGILYFPKSDNVYESLEGRIKIYYNQVFVADNIKEIIPEFLFLLKGTLDCPDLPLNVSRSFLQNDEYVSKLSSHIIRKVADKLNTLSKNDREQFEKYWQDIGVFVRYGMMRDDKFYEKVKEIALYKTVDKTYKTQEELGEEIHYTPDDKKQVAYVERAKARGLTVVVMDHELDNHYMSFLEYKNSKVKFKRVDADLGGETGDETQKEAVETLFRAATANEKLTVKMMALGADALPAMIVESEEARRMQEMRKQFERMGNGDDKMDFDSMFPIELSLVINQDQPLVARLKAMADLPQQKERAEELTRHVYDLARLGHGSLTAEELAAFLKRSATLLTDLAN